ncbi:endonuclease/exonuclease/phosphatase family protein [Haliangium sp.]|uniref:endonuclease/exonuclease/phosphatase family protein n=1 Tax=Haliangium sp. TaxID=2663208 RepID=UPI003D0AC93F
MSNGASGTGAALAPPRTSSGCVDLDPARERVISARVPADALAALRAIRTRRALLRAPAYQRHAAAIEDITFGLAHGQPARPAPRPARDFVRVVAWNIERGKRAVDVGAFLAADPVLSAADVVLLNEVDIGMARSGNLDVAATVADALGFEHVFGNSYLCLSQGNLRDGASDQHNRDGLHGNAVLSRYPLRRAECFSVAITKDKFESSEKRLGHKKALWAEVETPLGPLPVCALHLDSAASPAQRAAQLADALAVVDARGRDRGRGRCLIGGDFNTTTYDAKSAPRLVWNIARKLLRGGFAHAIHHYLHPDQLYEKAIFDALRAHGYDYASFNAPERGTSRYEVGSFDSESKVREHLPGIAVSILRWRLRPWNGVAPLKIDWFAGRGLRALDDGALTEADGRSSLAPSSFEKPRWQGRLLSDHDPIVVDVAW